MSEERTMILQMLAAGKISADEADRLLQAIEESEQPAAHRSGPEPAGPASRAERVGSAIDAAMERANRMLDEQLRAMDGRLQQEKARQERWQQKIGDAAEAALERVRQAEERAAQAAARIADLGRSPKVKVVRTKSQGGEPLAERVERFQLAAQDGDRLLLTNLVGDIEIDLVETDVVTVEARITSRPGSALGEQIELRRDGSDLKLDLPKPQTESGPVVLEGEQIHLLVQAPQAIRLQVESTVGDIGVKATGPITTWALSSRVGDIDLALPQGTGFRYQLGTKVGSVEAPGAGGMGLVTGVQGDGQGEIDGRTTMGDIRLHLEHGGF